MSLPVQQTQEKTSMSAGGIRTRNPKKRAATGLRGHRDRTFTYFR